MLHPRPKWGLKGCGFAQPSIWASSTAHLHMHPLVHSAVHCYGWCRGLASVVVPWQAASCLCNEEKPLWLPVWASDVALRIDLWEPFDTPRRDIHVTLCTLTILGDTWLSFSPCLIKHLCRCGPFHPSEAHDSKMHSALLLRSQNTLDVMEPMLCGHERPFSLCLIHGHPVCHHVTPLRWPSWPVAPGL